MLFRSLASQSDVSSAPLAMTGVVSEKPLDAPAVESLAEKTAIDAGGKGLFL